MTATTAGAEHCRAGPCVRRFVTYHSNNGGNLAQSKPVGDQRLALVAEVRLLAKQVESLRTSRLLPVDRLVESEHLLGQLAAGRRGPVRGFWLWNHVLPFRTLSPSVRRRWGADRHASRGHSRRWVGGGRVGVVGGGGGARGGRAAAGGYRGSPGRREKGSVMTRSCCPSCRLRFTH